MSTDFKIYGDSAKAISKIAQRDAVVALYQGRIAASEVVSAYPGVSRQRAVALANTLPKGLLEDNDRMQLTRAVNELVGVGGYGAYTTWELQQAIHDTSKPDKPMKPKMATAMYGVPGSTLRKKRQALVQIVGSTPEAKKVAQACRTILKGTSGPKPYLELDEEEVFLGIADQIAADGLPGRDLKRLGSEGRALCKKLAEGEPDAKKRRRLLSAKCDWCWATRLLKNHDNSVVATGGTDPNPNPKP